MCRGSMVCGKNVRSGSGKIGTKIWPTGPCASPDRGELEGRQAVEPLDHALGEVAERLGLGRVRLADRDGYALVAALARVHLEGDAREKGNVELSRDLLAAALAEDGVPRARVGGHEVAHVLHDAQDGHVELPEHAERLAPVEQGHVLR